MAVKKLINVDVIKKDLLIAKNVDYEQLFTITDKTTGSGVSFSGFTSSILTSRIKQHPNSTSVAATFTSSYSDASSAGKSALYSERDDQYYRSTSGRRCYRNHRPSDHAVHPFDSLELLA